MKLEYKKYALVTIVGLVPTLLFFSPLFFVIYSSFFKDNIFTIQNYADFFNSKMFLISLKNSFLITVSSTSILSVMGLLIVVAVRNNDRVKKIVKLLSSLPLVFSSYIFCISFIYIYGRAGIINHLFSLIGIEIPLSNILYSIYGIILINTIFYLPFFILPLFSSFEEVDPKLEEVAESLGSHGFHKFRRVIFPQVSHGFIVGILITFLVIFNQISIPLALGVGKHYTLTYLLFGQFERSKLGMANTIATISLLITFLVSFAFQFILKRYEKK